MKQKRPPWMRKGTKAFLPRVAFYPNPDVKLLVDIQPVVVHGWDTAFGRAIVQVSEAPVQILAWKNPDEVHRTWWDAADWVAHRLADILIELRQQMEERKHESER